MQVIAEQTTNEDTIENDKLEQQKIHVANFGDSIVDESPINPVESNNLPGESFFRIL